MKYSDATKQVTPIDYITIGFLMILFVYNFFYFCLLMMGEIKDRSFAQKLIRMLFLLQIVLLSKFFAYFGEALVYGNLPADAAIVVHSIMTYSDSLLLLVSVLYHVEIIQLLKIVLIFWTPSKIFVFKVAIVIVFLALKIPSLIVDVFVLNHQPLYLALSQWDYIGLTSWFCYHVCVEIHLAFNLSFSVKIDAQQRRVNFSRREKKKFDINYKQFQSIIFWISSLDSICLLIHITGVLISLDDSLGLESLGICLQRVASLRITLHPYIFQRLHQANADMKFSRELKKEERPNSVSLPANNRPNGRLRGNSVRISISIPNNQVTHNDLYSPTTPVITSNGLLPSSESPVDENAQPITRRSSNGPTNTLEQTHGRRTSNAAMMSNPPSEQTHGRRASNAAMMANPTLEQTHGRRASNAAMVNHMQRRMSNAPMVNNSEVLQRRMSNTPVSNAAVKATAVIQNSKPVFDEEASTQSQGP
ncbi:hypothetical protein BC833DRAFT_120836 [Globomyces pollinis-pini]|nr:hypothetical protein BC833DRAFT_120836 [Globomyces pollinis-pini]